MILRLRMLSDENDNFVRDFEVPHSMNLFELHNFIIKSIDYDDCMASFFSADEQWNPVQEFSQMDLGDEQFEGAPIAMEKVTLAELVVSECNRLIHQFDMIADRFAGGPVGIWLDTGHAIMMEEMGLQQLPLGGVGVQDLADKLQPVAQSPWQRSEGNQPAGQQCGQRPVQPDQESDDGTDGAIDHGIVAHIVHIGLIIKV
mgnify:CR=1 FL=1